MDFADHFRASLADRYIIERELGGGGMSQVFLAREIALDRRVVLKLVPPALTASVSTERFRREMLLVAQLQHTNIVPVLGAGEIDGTLFYSMPFVEGESLRARVDTAGRLAVDDVVSIAFDVLRALGYAHRRSIIHRDIKPDNILLADGGAMVTDFGIAKALGETTSERSVELAAADADDVGSPQTASNGALTQTGVIVGTPAYLAPEQAAPGAVVDGRTDLYALGCVMYEMLVGERVFAASSPQREMVAHLTTAAPAVMAKRPEVGRALSAFVARLLEKDPDRRPATAEDAQRELQKLRASGRRAAIRWATGGAVTISALAIVGYLMMPPQLLASARTLMSRRPAVLHVNRVVVVPFEDRTGDPKLASLGAMTADWIAEGLARVSQLEVVDANSAAISSEVVKRIPKFLRTHDDARAVAEEAGAKVIVAGAVYRTGDTLTLRARIVDASTGAIMQALPSVSGSAAEPGVVIERLGRRVVATLTSASDTGSMAMPGQFSSPPSLEAFEEVRKGIELFFRFDQRSFEHLHTAMRLDSTYAPPFVFNALASSVRLGMAAGDTAARQADRLRDRMTPAEKAMLDYVHAVVEGDPPASTEAAQRYMNVQKGSLEAPLLAASNAVATFHPQLALDALARSDPDRGMNLAGPFYWLYRAEAARQLGNLKMFVAAAREGRRRFPENPNSYALLVLALPDDGDLDELREVLRGIRDPLLRATMTVAAVGALLHDGRLSEARAMANDALLRIPAETERGRALAAASARAGLLLETERWAELEATTRLWADSAFARRGSLRMNAARAAALIHLQRRGEAKAIADAIAAEHPRYARGDYLYYRAAIAAQLGNKADAVSLLDDAVRSGYNLQFAGTHIGYDPLLLPLRGYDGFAALLKRGL